MKITTKDLSNITVVAISGKLTLGEATGDLRDTIHELVSSGKKNLLLDLSQLDYMDSAGLGEVVGAYTTVANAGGKLKLLKVGGRALDLLQVTKLATLFEFFDDEAAAALSFE